MSHRKHGNRPQPIPVPEPSEVPEQEEKKTSLLDRMKKIFVWVKPLDFVIMIVGGIMISRVDFSNVTSTAARPLSLRAALVLSMNFDTSSCEGTWVLISPLAASPTS